MKVKHLLVPLEAWLSSSARWEEMARPAAETLTDYRLERQQGTIICPPNHTPPLSLCICVEVTYILQLCQNALSFKWQTDGRADGQMQESEAWIDSVEQPVKKRRDVGWGNICGEGRRA